MAVIAAGGHNLAAHADGDGVATFFVLFHGVPHWTFGILGGIFVMDEDLCAHWYGYYSSQILIPFIVELAHIAGPEG